MMLEGLCSVLPAGLQGLENEHVPPVIAVTAVRKTVRVWAAYSSKPLADDPESAKFKMVCIWKGDMTVVLDIMKFSAILCNAHKWAVFEHRPRISGFIDLWKARYPMQPLLSDRREGPGLLSPSDTTTTRDTIPKPSLVGGISPGDRGRLLKLLEDYRQVLTDEQRERERLIAQVDDMQRMLPGFFGHTVTANQSPSSPLRPIQKTQSSPNVFIFRGSPAPSPRNPAVPDKPSETTPA
ncbi:hypothetical protein VTK26DRAFT_4150 [Humicola hyalothermophila]